MQRGDAVWIIMISIHAPREGSDGQSLHRSACRLYFNPRPPRGERLIIVGNSSTSDTFQSTPPARGATPEAEALALARRISIHAPREGSDTKSQYISPGLSHFNPRPPRGERLYIVTTKTSYRNFNPRPPRGERLFGLWLFRLPWLFQSTPPARGATKLVLRMLPILSISIHAPREGSDFLIRQLL